MSRFQILNANLQSIYSKRFNFMVYMFICVFREIKFFWLLNLLGLLKKTQHLDSWPLSMPWKTRPWGDLFKNIVLYLMTVSFIRMWESFKRVFFLRKYGNCFGSKFKMSPSTVGTKGRKLRPGWFTTLFSFERISSASLLFKHWITS